MKYYSFYGNCEIVSNTRLTTLLNPWGHNSAGRAPAWYALSKALYRNLLQLLYQ